MTTEHNVILSTEIQLLIERQITELVLRTIARTELQIATTSIAAFKKKMAADFPLAIEEPK